MSRRSRKSNSLKSKKRIKTTREAEGVVLGERVGMLIKTHQQSTYSLQKNRSLLTSSIFRIKNKILWKDIHVTLSIFSP